VLRDDPGALEELAALPIRNVTGRVFRLSELARLTPEEDAHGGFNRIDGMPSLSMSVQREATSDAIKTANAVLAALEQVKLALRRVKDPDLNLNIVDLGLVYDVRLIGKDVEVDMSLTSPGCPSGPEIMSDAERILKAVPGVGEVTINLVWTPFWSPDRIEPRVRAYMGL
jgi:metal-sulfur cluster biosynthetic enzyme